jgi:hypothetical protein
MVAHPDVQLHFLPSQVIDHGRKPAVIEAYQVTKTIDWGRVGEVEILTIIQWGSEYLLLQD